MLYLRARENLTMKSSVMIGSVVLVRIATVLSFFVLAQLASQSL